MRRVIVLAIGALLALSIGKAAADGDDHAPILVAPDQSVVQAGDRKVFVTVAAPDAPPMLRPRASLIVYKPDGTMRKFRSKSLCNASATFRVSLGNAAQSGTYTVYATVEVDTQAFGMPMTFEVASERAADA